MGTRGTCHNRSSAYDVDLSDRLTPNAEARLRVEAAIEAEDQAALLDSLTICKFLRHVFADLPAKAADLYAAVTGVALTADELRRTGARITTIKKRFNSAQGWTRADDTLPVRILDDRESAINREGLDALIAAYYAVRGWDADGMVPPDA